MSEIRANTVSDAAGTGPATLTAQWAAKATWNYEHNTPSLIGSENISSITDNGLGSYTPNFTNSFGAADYAVAASAGRNAAGGGTIEAYITGPAYETAPLATGSANMHTINNSASGVDGRVCGTVTGDLA